MDFSKVNVKIDKGCPRTSFPLLKFGISDYEAYRFKARDCGDSGVPKSIPFGVNDTKQKRIEDKRKFRAKIYMELNSISFRHIAENFAINDVRISDVDVLVSYDRTGNILIGMDILKRLETHIGVSKTGETVLLACPRENLTDEYWAKLADLFCVKSVYNI